MSIPRPYIYIDGDCSNPGNCEFPIAAQSGLVFPLLLTVQVVKGSFLEIDMIEDLLQGTKLVWSFAEFPWAKLKSESVSIENQL